MKIMFRCCIALVALVALVVVIAIVALSDANRFKPHIESFAKTQGVVLTLGQLEWGFFPRISLQADNVGVASLQSPNEPIATLGQARLELELLPLIRGDYRVNQISLANADIQLISDKHGKGNWEVFSHATAPAETVTPVADSAETTPLSLAVDKIQLRESQLIYTDEAAATRVAISDMNLLIDNANTRGVPFSVDGDLTVSQDSLVFNVALDSDVSVNLEQDTLQLRDTTLRVKSNGAASAEVVVTANVDVTALTNALAYNGKVSVQQTSVKTWLAVFDAAVETANADALTKVAMAMDVKGDLDQVALSSMVITIDNTQLTGHSSVKHFSKPQIALELIGNALNADDYLPPAQEDVATENDESATEDTPLPLELLRDLTANVQLRLAQLTLSNMQWNDVALVVDVKQGRLSTDFSATGYEGDVKALIGLDGRADNAQLSLDIKANRIALSPLMRDLEMSEALSLEGAISATVNGQSRGATVNTLVEKLDLTAAFNGAEVKLAPINLEQQFCRVVGLINQTETPERVWDAFTPLKELSGTITLKEQIVRIDRLTAGVEKLLITPTGHINLASDAYDISLPFKLVSDAANSELSTSASGCALGSNYWVEKGLELLRCRGSFASLNPLTDCRPDPAMLTALTKELALKALSDKHGINVDEQKQAVEAKVDEKKEELKEKVEEKKQELFNKLSDRLQRRASSSDAESSAADAGQ